MTGGVPVARVYISSTVADLREYREAAYNALRRLGHDVVAMEDFASADQRPLERCLAEVAASDIYVTIVAWRYGYVPPPGENPGGLSITELEYRHACQRGLPCLAFLHAEDAPWLPKMIDPPAGGGAEVERFRRELTEQQGVAFFDTPERLAQAVIAAVSDLAGDARARHEEAAGLRLVVAYAENDVRIARQVGDRLSELRPAGLVSRIDVTPITTVMDDGLRQRTFWPLADIVLLLMSRELLATPQLSQWLDLLIDRHRAGTRQLVPALARSISQEAMPPALRRIPPLPAWDHPVIDSSDRMAALTEVADGVQLICREILARRTGATAQLGGLRVRDALRPQRSRYRLVEVFKVSGVPSITFVEPPDFYQLKLALEQPGRGVVIEGPSGVGKTTALQTAVRQVFGDSAEFQVLSARSATHVARLADLRSWHRGGVAVDDFHRLPADLRADLADYIKLLADTEPADRKLVIVGIPGTRQRLVELAYDVATRVDVLSLGWVNDSTVLEMINKGEAALNITLDRPSEIVRTAAGSLNVGQVLCYHLVALDGVRETQDTLTPVVGDLRRATRKAVEMMALKFSTLVRAFAGLDGPSERGCLALLGELAFARDGVLPLRQLGDRRPELRAPIKRFVDDRLIDTLARRHSDPERHLFYDADAATLVIDDPHLSFYLRQLNLEALATEVGKRPASRRTEVFVSYSHKDKDWLELLRTHLTPLIRDGLVAIWDDTRIQAGSLWREEIDAALERARVAVLMVSADFLGSAFIRDNELPPLLMAAADDDCHVLPLLLRPSLFQETPELSRFHAVNPDGAPLSQLTEPQREDVLVSLARRIMALVGRAP
jgi:hypothetical protein